MTCRIGETGHREGGRELTPFLSLLATVMSSVTDASL